MELTPSAFEENQDQTPDQELVVARLLKTVKTKENEWSFIGIASDETMDEEGDEVLRKALDISYAQKRGYANWDHSRNPENQLGFLTKTDLIEPKDIKKLKKTLRIEDVELPETLSVYVEGELYPFVERAAAVKNLMKSIPDDKPFLGPGFSLDGVLVRNKQTREIVKAFVRGVAFTTAPANVNTMARMKKSLSNYSPRLTDETGSRVQVDIPAIAEQAKDMVLDVLKKSATGKSGMDFDTATLWVLKKNPTWTYDLAVKVVQFTVQKLK